MLTFDALTIGGIAVAILFAIVMLATCLTKGCSRTR